VRSLQALVGAWLALSGCQCATQAREHRYQCTTAADCAPEFTCVKRVCLLPDGGTGIGGGAGGGSALGGGGEGGGANAGGGVACSIPLPAPAVKTVFVTAATFTGNFGGVNGADHNCAAAAADAGLTGTFRAWLADSNAQSAPSGRFDTVGAVFDYQLTTGTSIATGWSALTHGALAAPIDRDEHQALVSATNNVWTNVKADGTQNNPSPNRACADWTTTQTTGNRSGQEGSSSSSTAAWTQLNSSPNCTQSKRLYCFEQASTDDHLTPDALSFGDTSDVPRLALINSDVVALTGLSVAVEVSVSGPGSPQYRVCCSADCSAVMTDWTSTAGVVGSGQYLQLRQTSSSDYSAATVAALQVGTLTSTWTVTTAAPVCGAGMVAWWKLDESTGSTAADARALNPGITLNGPIWQPMGGRIDGALQFDGMSTELNVPHDASLDFGTGPFAITGWVKGGAQTQDYGVLFMKAANGPAGRENGVAVSVFGSLMGNLPGPACVISVASAQLGAGPPATLNIMDDTWHHIACIRDTASNLTFYLDGVMRSSTQIPPSTSTSTGLLASLGHYTSWDMGGHLNGLLDDVRIYRRAPSATEIAAMVTGHDCVAAAPPDAFSFTSQHDVALTTQVSSEIVPISGAGQPFDVIIAGEGTPEYRICSASDCSSVVTDWTAASVTIASGQFLQLRQTSGGLFRTETVAVVTVGSAVATWGVTTIARDCGLGLVSKWKLDEMSGTIASDSQGQNNGAVTNGMWETSSGQLGGALDFDGTSTKLDVADSPSLNFGTGAFTLSGWVRGGAQMNEWTPLYEKMAGTQTTGADWTGVTLVAHGGVTNGVSYLRPECDFRSNGTQFWAGPQQTTFDITDNAWHHLACVRDADHLRMYLDGVQQSSWPIPAGTSFDTTVGVSIGYSRQWNNAWFSGLIDDVRVYGRALSPGEIADISSGASCD
jgi:hypothetical protein